MTEEKTHYSRYFVPPLEHLHTYNIVASGDTVIRYCPVCGVAWKLLYHAARGTYEWEPVREEK